MLLNRPYWTCHVRSGGPNRRGRIMRSTRNFSSVVGVLASLVIALIVSMAATPSAADAAAPGSSSAARVQVRSISSSYDYQILYWTNVARRQHGLRALKAGPCVDRFAESWTARMASRGYFGHQHLRPVLRRCHRHTAGENIARSSGSGGTPPGRHAAVR